MKTKLLYGVAAVILVALLAVAGCSNPLSGGSGTNVRQATVAVTDSGSLAALASGRVEIVLLAGQDQVAGTVNVTNDSENLYVEFLPSEQWCIIETHVHVANSLDGFPLVGRWQTPAPGQFDFKTEHNCEPPYEYTIALGDLDVHEDFIIAAHAKLSDGEVTETAWAAGTRFSDQGNWATYFTYSWTFMPEAYDLTGYWDAYLLMNGEREGPILLYLVQTGNTLDGFNTTGTVEGSVVTLSVGSDDEEAAKFEGTIEKNDYFVGSLDFYGELIAAEFWRVDDLQFGTLQLSGLVDFQSDKALGGEEPDYTEYFLRFQIKAGSLEGTIWFENHHGLAIGEYEVVDTYREEAGEGEVAAFFFDHLTWDEFQADEGILIIEQYNPDGVVSGSFEVYFEDSDNWLGGSFWLDQPSGNGAQVTITGGQWNGLPVVTGTTDGLSWESGEEFNHGPRYVAFVDENLLVFLLFQPEDGMAVGSFAVPDEMEVWFDYRPEGSEGIEEDRAVSGTVVVQTYQEGAGMSGYFSGVQFADTSGSLAGSFDVTFELIDREIAVAD